MCGIVGHVVAVGQTPDWNAVSQAMDKLRHRGPDGSGLARFDSACLGHTRLSIIDIEGSIQPWRSEDGRYTLVFNGEIYNYLELREELEKRGQTFRSHGDTEVLMNMFVHYREKCLERLNGMFAFAVWDEVERTLFMARDRLGKKPLYYSAFNRGIAFASEIPALLAFKGLDTGIDLEAVQEFFAYQFINNSKSIYHGIRKLLPAHYLVYGQEQLTIRRYWSPPHPVRTERRVSDLSDELVSLIDDAVRLRLRSDVPVGAFLSSGMDSAIMVATLARLGADLDTFTVGFSDPSFDESKEARITADYFKTRHHEHQIALDLPMLVEECGLAFGEPFADPSAIPTWPLCQYARRHVTVALSGDGGDELFGGYRRYFAAGFLPLYRAIPGPLRRRVFEPLVGALPEPDVYYGQSALKKLKLFLSMSQRLDKAPRDLLPQAFDQKARRGLFHEEVETFAHDHVSDFELAGLDLQTQMMQTDLRCYLSEDILTKVDRTSMTHSLEVRAPLLDYRIVEFACRLPTKHKIRGSTQKYLLRSAYRTQLPDGVLRKQKHGFAAPISQWLRQELQVLFEDYVFNHDWPEFLNRSEVRRLWSAHRAQKADYGFKLWTILMFFVWYTRRARYGRR